MASRFVAALVEEMNVWLSAVAFERAFASADRALDLTWCACRVIDFQSAVSCRSNEEADSGASDGPLARRNGRSDARIRYSDQRVPSAATNSSHARQLQLEACSVST
jgi:hypothetical protein